MKLNRNFPSICFLAISALGLAACDMREPAVTPSGSDSATPAAAAEPAAASDVAAEKGAALLAGLNAIQPLVKEKVAAYQPVEPLGDNRLLLHPGEGKRARLVIDVSGLSSLTLSPVIESFQGNATCEADPSAGVAGLHYHLDNGPVSDVAVDRNYSATIKVDVVDAKQLVIESSDQNGVIWCDWLAVGFTEVTSR